MIATVHGAEFTSLVNNPELNALVGGVASVTIGDAEMLSRAKRFGTSRQKNIRERSSSSPFSMLVELLDHSRFRVYHSVDDAVDGFLANGRFIVEERVAVDGRFYCKHWIDSPSLRKASNQRASVPNWYEKLRPQLKGLKEV